MTCGIRGTAVRAVTALAVAGLLGATCVGCASSRLTDAAVIGTWVADSTAGAQTIVFSRDHSFRQVIDRGDSLETTEGTWTLVESPAQAVVLHDAMLFDNNARTVPAWSRGDWSLRPRDNWSGLHLTYEGAYPSGFTKSPNPDRRPPG